MTTERREWVPIDAVLRDLREKLATGPDYVTLSGSGEPTLYSELGPLISRIRRFTDVPVAVLTNGSLLADPSVRRELAGADLVIPSLDAGDPSTFAAINRPHEDVDFDAMVDGLVEFAAEHPGRTWLEVFVLDGVNDADGAIDRIATITRRVRPLRTQLNTATRPTAERFARPVDAKRLARIARRFVPPAEVVADYRGVHGTSEVRADRETVLEIVRRRPCSLADIAEGLRMHRNEVVKHLGELEAERLIEREDVAGTAFYRGRVTE